MISEKKYKFVFEKYVKPLYKPFLIVFFLAFMIINWNNISWIFDYRFISAKIGDALNDPTGEIPVSDILGAVWNKSKLNVNIAEHSGSIEIPRINIVSPIVFVEDEKKEYIEPADLKKYLDKGVLHYPNSALPGKRGVTTILGHSAPLGWPKVRYDWVFSDLNKLKKGDEIFIFYNGKKYTYIAEQTIYLDKGGELPQNGLTKSKNMLALISCWPPGKDNRRIAVEAVMY